MSTMAARNGLPQVNGELRAGVTLLESKKTARYLEACPRRDRLHAMQHTMRSKNRPNGIALNSGEKADGREGAAGRKASANSAFSARPRYLWRSGRRRLCLWFPGRARWWRRRPAVVAGKTRPAAGAG